jgi:hypothetical protein
MFRFGKPGKLTVALKAAGFSDAEERLEEVQWDWPGPPEDFWDYFREVTVPFRPLFQAIPAKMQDEVHASVLTALGQRFDGTAIRFGARVLLASGTGSTSNR